MNFDTALLNVRQMSEADRLAVAAGVPAVTLMENAGRAVAQEIGRRWSACPVSVLCGPGNNGGDGFVAARLLAETGWPVRLALLGARQRLTGEARHHAERWSGTIEPLTPAVLDEAELVVDALFGAGLNRAPAGPAADLLAAVAGHGRPIVAVDVPSGVLGDTGASWGAVAAVLTVTFFRKKPGHLLLPGRGLCGKVVVADIGIPAAVLDQIVPDTFENDPCLWRTNRPRRGTDGVPATRHDTPILFLTPEDDVCERGSVPGVDSPEKELTLGSPEPGWKPVPAGGGYVRPHPGPLPQERENIRQSQCKTKIPAVGGSTVQGEDLLTRARAAARLSGAVVVLSGGDTVIATPDGQAVIQAGAPPSSAIASSGDEAGGLARGLVAEGMDPWLAAAAAVWQTRPAARNRPALE